MNMLLLLSIVCLLPIRHVSSQVSEGFQRNSAHPMSTTTFDDRHSTITSGDYHYPSSTSITRSYNSGDAYGNDRYYNGGGTQGSSHYSNGGLISDGHHYSNGGGVTSVYGGDHYSNGAYPYVGNSYSSNALTSGGTMATHTNSHPNGAVMYGGNHYVNPSGATGVIHHSTAADPQTGFTKLTPIPNSEAVAYQSIPQYPAVAYQPIQHNPAIAYQPVQHSPPLAYQPVQHSPQVAYQPVQHSPQVAYQPIQHSPQVAYQPIQHSPPVAYQPVQHSPPVAYQPIQHSPLAYHPIPTYYQQPMPIQIVTVPLIIQQPIYYPVIQPHAPVPVKVPQNPIIEVIKVEEPVRPPVPKPPPVQIIREVPVVPAIAPPILKPKPVITESVIVVKKPADLPKVTQTKITERVLTVVPPPERELKTVIPVRQEPIYRPEPVIVAPKVPNHVVQETRIISQEPIMNIRPNVPAPVIEQKPTITKTIVEKTIITNPVRQEPIYRPEPVVLPPQVPNRVIHETRIIPPQPKIDIAPKVSNPVNDRKVITEIVEETVIRSRPRDHEMNKVQTPFIPETIRVIEPVAPVPPPKIIKETTTISGKPVLSSITALPKPVATNKEDKPHVTIVRTEEIVEEVNKNSNGPNNVISKKVTEERTEYSNGPEKKQLPGIIDGDGGHTPNGGRGRFVWEDGSDGGGGGRGGGNGGGGGRWEMIEEGTGGNGGRWETEGGNGGRWETEGGTGGNGGRWETEGGTGGNGGRWETEGGDTGGNGGRWELIEGVTGGNGGRWVMRDGQRVWIDGEGGSQEHRIEEGGAGGYPKVIHGSIPGEGGGGRFETTEGRGNNGRIRIITEGEGGNGGWVTEGGDEGMWYTDGVTGERRWVRRGEEGWNSGGARHLISEDNGEGTITFKKITETIIEDNKTTVKPTRKGKWVFVSKKPTSRRR